MEVERRIRRTIWGIKRQNNLWCVVIKKKDAADFLAFGHSGMAVFSSRLEAYKLARELREYQHHFRARVEPCSVVFGKK